MNSKSPPPKWLTLPNYLASPSPPAIKAETSDPYPNVRLINRNLSWLAFNDRVLNEAADPSVPILERLRFLGIVSSNLDEFFMVRVADVIRKARRQPTLLFPDGISANQLVAQIREHVIRQKARQAEIFRSVLSGLEKEGIRIISSFGTEDSDLDREVLERMPDVKFILRSNAEPIPRIMSERINVFIRFPGEYAILSLAERADRLVQLPSGEGEFRFVLLEKWLCARAGRFFPGREIMEAFPFKIIRDADLNVPPDETDALEDQIVQAVFGRHKAKVVRLEIDAPAYSEGGFFLATAFGLDSSALYRFNLPLDLRTLGNLSSLKESPGLTYPEIKPLYPESWKKAKNIFHLIKKHDVILHHPYDSFDIVVRFIQEAAKDPKVTAIYHTMYRTTRESPLMEALRQGALNGKNVTVYIEIKARFDELNNVRWAKELRAAGVKVVRPLGGFKVHCKVTQIVRQEREGEISYLHLGTGNYHPKTARQYTDLGLLTQDKEMAAECREYYLDLAKGRKPKGFKDILVAPGNLHREFLRLIKEETQVASLGGNGHIIAKMNSLVDPDVIEALYGASNAGVKIDLIVRGICCLRPGLKGMSENIRVTSIIDRFLEHSRIYYFYANGEEKIYLASADWMPRNFYTRFEIAFPVKDSNLKRYLRDVILQTSLNDNVKASTLLSDGSYLRRRPEENGPMVRSQFAFEELAQGEYRNTILSKRIPSPAKLNELLDGSN